MKKIRDPTCKRNRETEVCKTFQAKDEVIHPEGFEESLQDDKNRFLVNRSLHCHTDSS